MEDYNPIGRVKNRNGQIQSQIKFKITDGRLVPVFKIKIVHIRNSTLMFTI